MRRGRKCRGSRYPPRVHSRAAQKSPHEQRLRASRCRIGAMARRQGFLQSHVGVQAELDEHIFADLPSDSLKINDLQMSVRRIGEGTKKPTPRAYS